MDATRFAYFLVSTFSRQRWDSLSAVRDRAETNLVHISYFLFYLGLITIRRKSVNHICSTNVRLSAKREALSHAEHYSEQRGGKLRAGVPDSAESTLNIVWDTVVLSRLDSAELQHFHLVFFIWSFTVTFTFTTLSQLRSHFKKICWNSQRHKTDSGSIPDSAVLRNSEARWE